ncbi:hypothetical protein BH09BAC5_BH09BAC5_10230 [soil metagenome]
MKITLLFSAVCLVLSVNAQTNHWETAVNENDTWKYVVPTSEPDTNWRKISFNASSWNSGQGGIGYGDGDDNTIVATTPSVFMRIAFNISDTSKISEAILNADYDDGFVAYLNNVEIFRSNVNTPGRPPFNSLAAANHEAVMYSGGNPDYNLLTEIQLEGLMMPGTNVLAIQVYNVTANSSDLSGRFWLSFGIHDASTFWGSTPTWFSAPVSFTSSDLPLVVINTNNQTIPDSPKLMVDFGIIYNGVGNRNYLTDPWNNYSGKVGIEIRGSSSQMFPKKSYGFECWDVNGNAIDSSLLSMPAESDWCLIANYTDKSLLNNSLSYYLSREMGWYAPRWRCVEVIIDGQYMGVYLLTEKIKRDHDRVNIAKMLQTDISGDQLTGGYIIKIDKMTASSGAGWTSNFAPAVSPNNQTIYFQYDYPSDVLIEPQQQTYIQMYVDSFETALAGPNFMDTAIGYSHYMNVNSFIDYFLVDEMAKNVDGYRLSTYLFKDKNSNGGKLTIGPVWDYDISWGNANYCDGAVDTGWAYQFGNVCGNDNWQIPFWWDRLMQDPAFRDKVKCRWSELSQTILSKQYLFNYCDSMAILLNESQQRNFVQWPILGAYVWPNPSPIPTTYQGEIDELKSWIDNRWNWLDANMPGTLANCNLSGIPAENSTADFSNAYPNPFNNEINLSLYLPDPQTVKVELINSLGQTIQLQTIQHAGGTQVLQFTADENLPSGIYLLRLTAGNKVWTQQVSKFE